MRKTLQGIAASPGVGVGRIQLYQMKKIDGLKREIQDRAAELERYRFAVDRFCELLTEKVDRIAQRAGETKAGILRSQIEMAKDPYLNGQVEGRIASFQSAEAALDATCTLWMREFKDSDNEMLQLRAVDIQDMRDGLLRVLLGLPDSDESMFANGAVLVAKELPPSAMTAIDPDAVSGIILCSGGRGSHCAILARAMGIPTVVGASEAIAWARNGEIAVVDGGEGYAYLSPNDEEMAFWSKKRDSYIKGREALRRYVGRNAATADSVRVDLTASVGSESESLLAAEYGCDGIGLLRSEFLFLDRPSLPDEEEQFRIYRRIAEGAKGEPVVIRTLDVGGDKRLPGISWEREDNPFLGCRAIRLSMRETDLFRTQMRAILRAGAYGDVRVMIPMISSIDEFRRAKHIFKECKEELEQRGENYRADMPFGMMAETPAAAVNADIFAREADFISIGVNDLTQYTMAVDRDNAKVSYLYSHYDPSLLRLIRRIVECCKAADTPLSMCGQAAADPLFLPLILSWGIKSISVQPTFLLSTRHYLSLWTKKDAIRVGKKAMELESEDKIRRLLEENQRV